MGSFSDAPLNELLRSPWVLGPLAFVLWTIVFLVVKQGVLRALQRVAARTEWTWDDVLVRALSAPLLLAIVASGLLVLGRILPLPPEGDRAFDVMLAAALALALVLFVDRVCGGILDRLAVKTPVFQGARGLVQGIVRGVILGIGALIFLDSIGISITPILASLGVGSLAVALALKDTLANLFAGIHMILDKPIEPGHFIRLESGEEGTVSRVGWRSTRMRSVADHLVVVPNSKLAESVIANYSLPDAGVDAKVDVGVHYDSDLERVERVTLEVAREVMTSVEGGSPHAEPRIRYHTFADSSVNFSAILRAANYEAIPRIRHEFIKRLHSRYHREGIVIPFPIRTLDLPPDRPEDLRTGLISQAEDTGAGPTPADRN